MPKGVDVCPCVHCPQSDRIVFWPTSPSCECVSIGTERYASDVTRMPGESVGVRTCVHCPQENRAVETPTCECVSIGTERYA